MEINRENVMKATLKIENSMNECEILQLCSILLLGISHNKERSNNLKTTQLIKGRTCRGTWYVRPLNLAGEWSENGELMSGRTMYESKSEIECDVFIENYELLNKCNK